MPRRISKAKKDSILEKLKKGISAKKITQAVGVSAGTVRNIKGEYFPDVITSKGGRPRKISERMMRRILYHFDKGDIETVPQAADLINEVSESTVGLQTVRDNLHEMGWRGYVIQKKPLLSKQNIKKRLAFAKEHQNWTIQDWSRVLWTDECKIELLSSAGRRYHWRN